MKVLVSGYEVLERCRGNVRKLECCSGEADDGTKRRTGHREQSQPIEIRVILSNFSFFQERRRQAEAAMQGSRWECVVRLALSGYHGFGSGTTCE